MQPFYLLLSPHSQSLTLIGVVQKVFDGLSEGLRIPERNEQAVVSIVDDITDRPSTSTDHGLLM
jgi:hypothetical protein